MISEETFVNPSENYQVEEEQINLREIIEKLKYNWKWYLLSAILAIFLAFFYLNKTLDQYKQALDENGEQLLELSSSYKSDLTRYKELTE